MASIDESHEVEGIEYIYKRNFVFGNPYFELMTFKDFSEGGVVKLYNKEFSLNDMLEHAEIVFNSANVKRNIIFAKKNIMAYPNMKLNTDDQGNMPAKAAKLKFKKKKKVLDEAELMDSAAEDKKEKKPVVPKLKVRK